MIFTTLLDEPFTDFNTNLKLTPVKNKFVLSLVNDFEDKLWRYEKFDSFIWDNIAETALSASERKALIGDPLTLLKSCAKKLRLTDKSDTISQGSELAEIVLYGIMKHHYKALSVVPKIFYKQNPQDNAKGADSVHILKVGKDDFSLWFGEAKFYNSIEDARLPEIIKSVQNSLSTSKLKKENSIITNLSEIDIELEDKKLTAKIKDALSNRESIDNIKSKIHIPILLLHECDITKKHNKLSEAYKKEIIAYHKTRSESYFAKQLKKFGKTLAMYSEITFHVILFPVPDKKTIVDSFVGTAEFLKK